MAEVVGQLLSVKAPGGGTAAREVGTLPAARWPLVIGLSLAVHLVGWTLVTQAWEKALRAAAVDRSAPTVLIQVVQAPPRPPAPPPTVPEPPPEIIPAPLPEPTPPPVARTPPPKPAPVKRQPKPRSKPKPQRKPPSQPMSVRSEPTPAPSNPPPLPASSPVQRVALPEARPTVATSPRPAALQAVPREALLASYLARLQAAIGRHRFYPARSRRRGEQGRVLLSLRIGRDGTLQAMALSASSGHKRLDRAALQTLERLGKAPPLPQELPDDILEVEVPIRFRLRD